MRLFIALALLLQDSLVEDFRSDDVSVRDAASRWLRALGRDGVPRIREALARETDPEARARLSDLLTALCPVRAELTVRNPRLKVGERPDWSVRIVNEKDVAIVLARTLRGSGSYARYPLIDMEVEEPDGMIRSGRDCLYDWMGMIRELEADLFVDVPSKGVFRPIEAGREKVLWFDRWVPERPGRHRLRFVYDTSPRRFGAWAEHSPPELQSQLPGRRLWARCQVQDPSPEVAARFRLLHHERLVSPWVDLEVGP